ncbi:shikimate dehydrogenase [Marivibrio halodurans]|uniref:Shikimate dehydrogenase (NADP(+)) n=1 Tax=Marivibrio halodurans TaxID=2039722 RepID=A0A8J7S3R5_9PROT|nr:shikimate dehydrogenase [Marivibrio halodurans]MBP5858164.1 shikimate dehydrogenase [Marivibrio halodurans]
MNATETLPRAGVVGYPIGHSLSPVLHRHWLARYGIAGRYDPVEIPPDSFESEMARLFAEPDWRGCNVTVPHKEAAFRWVDRRDAAAERLGAVNTLVRLPDGGVEGRNTDLHGFRRNLETAAAWSADLPGRGAAVVIGAGGAARAVVAALQDLGFPLVHVLNRSPGKAEALADLLSMPSAPVAAGALDRAPSVLADAALLVNTTSLGMRGQPALALDLGPLPTGAFVTDIVYNPLETPLLAAARARGNPTVDGLGMLLHQAAPGFRAWFEPPESPVVDTSLRDVVLRALAA